jgi:hypothetical protein
MSGEREGTPRRVRAAYDALARRPWFPRVVDAIGWVVVAAILTTVYAGFLLENLEYALEPGHLNGDARQQIPPFYRLFGGNRAFDGDYLTQYYYDAYPLGYRWLFAALAKAGIDPYLVGNYLPYPLTIFTAVCLMVAANRFGGKPAALAVGCLWLGGGGFNQMGGGLPRAFAFPTVAMCIMGLSLGRPRVVGGAALLGAAFYPMAGVISGLSLLLWMLLPSKLRGGAQSWSPKRRAGEVMGWGALSVIVLLPMLLGTRPYGPLARPYDDVLYPEAGRNGRYNPVDKPPFRSFPTESSFWVERYLINQPGEYPLLDEPHERLSRDRRESLHGAIGVIFAVALFGWGITVRKRPGAARASLILAASVILFLLARFVVPQLYLPARYPKFVVPTLAMLLCAVGPLGLLLLRQHSKLQRTVASVALCIVVVGIMGGRGNPKSGVELDVSGRLPLLQFISNLEEGVLIAGMPNGVVENVPYVSRRPALLTREMHQAFHSKFILETRGRMDALIDAYFAGDMDPVRDLVDRYGVTHMVIRHSDFGAKPPGYHAPFARRIKAVASRNRGSFVMPKLAEGPAAVYEGQGFSVIDLRVALRAQAG